MLDICSMCFFFFKQKTAYELRSSDWSSDVSSPYLKIDRVQRGLDDNEDAQRRSQREQDGSEVRSVELERLIAQGLTLIERRNAFEFLRDHAAELFEGRTGSAWKPLSGSKVNHRALTAAIGRAHV